MSTSGRGINWRPRFKLVVRLARSVFFAAGASAERRSPSLVCELTETDCRVHAVLRQSPEGASVHQLETAGWVYISRQYPAENEPRPLSSRRVWTFAHAHFDLGAAPFALPRTFIIWFATAAFSISWPKGLWERV